MRINREIRTSKVRLIGKDGKQIGVVPLKQALEQAEEDGLDLVEISPNALPPVCKIIDYGKYRYQQTKKEKDSKKAQHQTKLKEIKMKPNIDDHDYFVKVKKAKNFLLKGDKVRMTCMFRGREMAHTEIGMKLAHRFIEDLAECSTAEAKPKLMGRNLTLVLAPSSVKKMADREKTTMKGENRAKDENKKSGQ